MKIAYVFDAIYPYNLGGKEKRLFDISKNLSEKNEVHIYSMNWWKGKKIKKENNVSLHGICKYYPLYIKGRRSIKQGIMFGLSCFKLLNEDFDVLDADHMVYFHLFPAKLACLLKGKKFIITWNEVWGKDYWINYMGRKGIFGAIIEKLTSKLPDKIISVSEHTTKNLIEKLKVNPEKIITIPNGIEFNKIQKVNPAKESSDIIFAGRLLSHKNVDLLIKAVKIIKENSNKNIKCAILGEGPELEDLQQLTKKLKLEKNIKILGFIKKSDDVYSLIKSSKVFVLPSEREGFGIAALEANACGIPVVTVNHKDNASKDLIKKGKNGFVCKLDEKALAETIIKAIKTSSSMKEACIKEAKKYDWSKIMSKFEEVYRE